MTLLEQFGAALLAAKEIFSIELTLGELTFSFWQIFLWSIVATIVVILVMKWVD